MRRISLVALLSLFPSTALGVSFSVPLPDLIGVIDFSPAEGREASFDFSQQFSQIDSVWIEVEAKVAALQFDSCGTFFDPQPCVHEVFLLGFYARLDKEGSPRLGTVFSDGLSFSEDSHAPEGYGVDTAIFNNPLVGWDFLLDGEGSLILYWNGLLGDPDEIVQNVILPSGEIFSARLIIDGTPIPEPSTALLVASGLLLMPRIRGNRRSPSG